MYGRIVQPQFAYKGIEVRVWLIQKPTKFLSLISPSKAMPITPGTYFIKVGEEFQNATEKPYILTKGEGKQLIVSPLSGGLNQQVNL